MSLFESYLIDNNTPNLAHILNNANAGIWELDTHNQQVKWSGMFYRLLGYEPGEIECSYNNLIENLVYHQDKNSFIESIYKNNSSSLSVIYVRILTKNGYEWFQSSTKRHENDPAKITGTIVNINHFKDKELKLATKATFLNETNKLVKLGGWEIGLPSKRLFLSDEALSILELTQQPDSVDELIARFDPEYTLMLSTSFEECLSIGRPFEHDLKLTKTKGKTIWVKLKAVADNDDYGKNVLIKGIIQDIDQIKQKENKLQTKLKHSSLTNERLQNFAYIVSHNLRSYAGNLQLMLNLHDEAKDLEDQQEILGHIKTISSSLEATIKHLNEIVKIDSEKDQERTLIEFKLLFKNIVNALQSNIHTANAIVKYDFSACTHVYYLPAYLESIFHNLLSNAIKYRSPNRQPVITCRSYTEDNHVYLIFEDNGTGIDMEKHRNKIFGMYQKFHGNSDAQGIGLYITRNQIESLGGTIEVESTLNVGTRFIIMLE